MAANAKKTDSPLEMFNYETKGGETVSLLPFNRLPSKVFRRNRDSDEFNLMFSIIESATDEAGLEVVDEMPLEELGEMFTEWSEASGAELGKH